MQGLFHSQQEYAGTSTAPGCRCLGEKPGASPDISEDLVYDHLQVWPSKIISGWVVPGWQCPSGKETYIFENGLTNPEKILEKTPWSLSLLWSMAHAQQKAKPVQAFQVPRSLTAKHQERDQEKAWLQVGVANFEHVRARGTGPSRASSSWPPRASCWRDDLLVQESLEHSLKSSKNRVKQSSKELLVPYDKACIFQNPINNSSIQHLSEASGTRYLR